LRELAFKDFVTLQRGFDLPKKDRSEGEFPVVASTSIESYHFRYKVGPPGVVTGRSGSLGKVLYIDRPFWPLNTTLWVKDFKGNVPKYVYYLFKTLGLAQYNSGAGVPTLNRNHLDTLRVKVHGIEDQRRIASILSAYDDLIENNTRRITILEEMARALYREWFVHFRQPGHNKVKMVESSLGPIPAGWEIGRLDDALVLQRGFDLPIKQRREGKIPVYAATGIVGYHDEAKVKGPGVVTGRSGSLGTVLYVDEDFWPLNTALWVKEFRRATPLYAFYLLSGLELGAFNSGAAVPTLNRNDIHGLPVVLPPPATLEHFDKHAGSIWAMKRNLAGRNANLRTTRDLLLPKVISGEIDVSKLGIAGQEATA
jgi:type I restriction enzyme S subunit